MGEGMVIREVRPQDVDALWGIFTVVVAGGDAYAFAPGTERAVCDAYWFGEGVASFVAEHGGGVVGMYRLCANQPGLGDHVANASFMVSPAARGLGVGETLGRHALVEAKRRGFRAMQFNFVVSSNKPAVRLWEKLGFSVIGTVPKGFRHASLGDVDVLILHRPL